MKKPLLPKQSVKRVTHDDYMKLAEDGPQYELVDGRLEMMSPAPGPVHQTISSELARALSLSCRADFQVYTAPIDVVLSMYEVRQPDVVLIALHRLHIYTNRGIVEPPDLVVEILSPSTVERDRQSKRLAYGRFGVPEYWIVDPETRTLEQYLLSDNALVLTATYAGATPVASPHLPCIRFTMDEVTDRLKYLN